MVAALHHPHTPTPPLSLVKEQLVTVWQLIYYDGSLRLTELFLQFGRSCLWVMTWCGHEGNSQSWANCRPNELAGLHERVSWMCGCTVAKQSMGVRAVSLVSALKRCSHKSIEKTCLFSRWGNQWPGFPHCLLIIHNIALSNPLYKTIIMAITANWYMRLFVAALNTLSPEYFH